MNNQKIVNLIKLLKDQKNLLNEIILYNKKTKKLIIINCRSKYNH